VLRLRWLLGAGDVGGTTYELYDSSDFVFVFDHRPPYDGSANHSHDDADNGPSDHRHANNDPADNRSDDYAARYRPRSILQRQCELLRTGTGDRIHLIRLPESDHGRSR
jgi:hypothetical protein